MSISLSSGSAFSANASLASLDDKLEEVKKSSSGTYVSAMLLVVRTSGMRRWDTDFGCLRYSDENFRKLISITSLRRRVEYSKILARLSRCMHSELKTLLHAA